MEWYITFWLVFISSHVTAIVTSYMMSEFGIRKKIQERSGKNLIEFYDFWWKPGLNRIKWRKVKAGAHYPWLKFIKEIQISHRMTMDMVKIKGS